MTPPAGAPRPDDASLDALARGAVAALAAFDPVQATGLGDHSRDDALPEWGPDARRGRAAELRALEADLDALDPAALSPDAAVDREVLRSHVRRDLLGLEERDLLARDPLVWVGHLGAAFHGLLAREFAPLSERVGSLCARVEAAPAFLDQARATLRGCSALHVEVARQQLEGVAHLLDGFVDLPGAPQAMGGAVSRAREALDAFDGFLREELAPAADPEAWRLGEELWGRTLAATLDTGLSVEELEEEAFLEVCVAQRAMLRAARRILGEAEETRREFPMGAPLEPAQRETILRALEQVTADRPARGELVEACAASVEEVRAWAADADALPDCPPDTLRIELWPEHSRGVAVACLDPPGPFEEGDAAAFFYVSPVPEAWDEARATSFLREYNRSQLRVLAAHEAVPGHFLQLAFARRHPSVVRAAFPSGTFVEGWAVYSETLLLEGGFRDGDPAYELCLWKMRLRTAMNALLDHSLHTGKRTPEQCHRMLVAGGFQEEGEAYGKVRRGQLTAAQLSTYFVGVQEVMELRHAHEARVGAGEDLRGFHRRLLSHGSVAARHLGGLLGLHSKEA